MTSPLSWTSPAPVDAAPPLVVRTDRRSARRWLTSFLVADGLLAVFVVVAMLWAASTTDAWGAVPMAITLGGCVFQMVFLAFTHGRLLGADPIAEIGPTGVRGPTKRWVVDTVPWSAVASVTSSWNAVVVKRVPGAGPPLVIPTRATDATSATMRAAVHHFSGGRL